MTRLLLVLVMLALSASSAYAAGSIGRMLDLGDGGGCTVGDDWYAGGHHYHCTNWNGAGVAVEIP